MITRKFICSLLLLLITAVITIAGNRTFRDDADSCSTITFDLSNNNNGFYWTPFYKYVTFSATAICNQWLKIRDKSRDYKFCKFYNLRGTITITGSIHVTGLCSYYEVKNLILNGLAQTVHQQGRAQLQNL
jgi:hypothetical protein